MLIFSVLVGITATIPIQAEESTAWLELRQLKDGKLPTAGMHIPTSVVQVFVYEGAPRSVRVTGKHIAVDYGKSGSLFDRSNSQLAKRFTVADGWPQIRPDAFAPATRSWRDSELVGPGVLYRWRDRGENEPAAEVVTEIAFNANTWRAMQPAKFLNSLGKSMSWKEKREKLGTWSTILEELNKSSYVEAVDNKTAKSIRYAMEQGLAGNIVTHLVIADGTLWAACVDIYDPGAESWGPGGLCRFNAGSNRWEKITSIDGHPVRWVTLLQTAGDELWVGFREGSGVEGDNIAYGMGLYPGCYRPKTTAVVIACLKNGEWQTFSRAPRDEGARSRYGEAPSKPMPSTETPVLLGTSGQQVILYTQTQSIRLSGNWDVEKDGQISLLDLPSGEWTHFDLQKDLNADQLDHFVSESGEIIVTSNRGVHRWDPRNKTWKFLDSYCDLKNPAISAATPVANTLWVGYMNQAFGVIGDQGISCFDEKTATWSYMSPEKLGTHCPVKRIAATTDGEVWVLFGQRPWLGSAGEFGYYPRENRPMPDGIARYASGKWEFPAKTEGILLAIEHERKGPTGPEHWTENVRIGGLVTVSNKVFVATTAGVYMGPNPWKKILAPTEDRNGFFDCGDHIEASDDGMTLVILRRDPKDNQSALRARFMPPAGKILFEKIKLEDSAWRLPYRGYLLEHGENTRWGQDWASIPLSVCDGEWVVGPFGGTEYRSVVETPASIWFASSGELVRLDRQKLAGWLRKASAGE